MEFENSKKIRILKPTVVIVRRYFDEITIYLGSELHFLIELKSSNLLICFYYLVVKSLKIAQFSER